MIHAPCLIAKVRSNEQLKWMVMANSTIGSVFGPTSHFKFFTIILIKKMKVPIFFNNPLDLCLPTWENLAPPYTSPSSEQNVLSDQS